MFDPPIHPLPYAPSLEEPLKDEAEVEQGIIEQILKISQVTYDDGGHAMRGVHAKSHGILKGKLIVLDALPPVLAQGLFAHPGRYDTIMRFSTSPGDVLDDSISTPRGLAIKVFGVEGGRLPGSEGAETQDFVLVNGKAFSAPNPKVFLANLKLLAGTTDKAEGLKKVLSATLRGLESIVEAVGGESATLKSLGGYPETHILGDSFFSQVPLRYGEYVAKIGVRPISPELTALTDASLDFKDRPNALRDAVRSFFASHGGEWEIVAQLAINPQDTPIENAQTPWPEDKTPYLPIARLVLEPQESWDEAVQPRLNDALVFSPWHGLLAHQPLGSVMRVRKAVYEASARFRLPLNGCPMHEPASLETIAG